MHRLLAGLLDRAIAWRTGRRYLEHLALYRQMERWDRERLDAWRLEKLQGLLDHAYRYVPYWKQVFDDLGARPDDFREFRQLRSLPALTKQIITDRGEQLLSSEGGRGKLSHKSTGGSTGHNIFFTIDRETHDWRRAAGRLTESWDDVVPGTRTVTLWGAAIDRSPSRGARLYDKLANRLFLSTYGVGEAELSTYFDKLKRFRPEIIVTYPSILLHLARQIGKTRCRSLDVRVIYCSSEALYEPVREELEDLFSAPVRNRYASREFGMIASDCPEGEGLHLLDPRLIVESDDPDPGDRPSGLVITDLDNRVMPFIRYKIEDLGVFESAPCRCGRSLSRLRAVEGRSLDVIQTPDGRVFGGTFFTIALRPFDRAIEQFQAIQESLDHVVIKLVPGPGYGPDGRQRIEARVREGLGPQVRLEINEVDEIPRLASGKRRFVISKLNG